MGGFVPAMGIDLENNECPDETFKSATGGGFIDPKDSEIENLNDQIEELQDKILQCVIADKK